MMKKILLLALSAIIIGCGKNQPENNDPEEPQPASYSFYDDTNAYDTFKDKADAAGFEPDEIDYGAVYTIFEYKGSQRICENVIKNPRKGNVSKFTANERTEYVTVHVYLFVHNHLTNKNKDDQSYVSTAFYLTPGKDTEIHITSTTHMSKTEPKL